MFNSKEFIVKISNTNYFGWIDVSVSRSIESLCGKFSINLIAKDSDEIPEIVPGASIEILINNEVVIDGFIDGMNISISDNQNNISITGRDKTSDLIDCSIGNTPFSWNKKTLQGMCEILCASFNLSVKVDAGLNDFAQTFTAQIGESPFDLISKAAKERGIIVLSSMPRCKLWLTSTGTTKCFDGLKFGENIFQINFGYEYSDRFYKYVVKGQRTTDGEGWNASSLSVSGESLDPNIRASRIKLFQADDQPTIKSATSRAKFESISRAAQAENMSITMVGFFQSNGELWKENKLVDVIVSKGIIKIEGEYLIVSVEYVISESGKFTNLVLKRKDAYVAEPKIKKTKTQGLTWL